MRTVISLVIVCLYLPCFGQSYRGLSIISDNVAWMSGSRGTVVRTSNGGKSWDTLSPKGFERKDFRDIHAWNAKEAIVMSAGDSAVLLYTKNGGKNWSTLIDDNSEGVFWDAIDVKGENIVLIGDGRKENNRDLHLISGLKPLSIGNVEFCCVTQQMYWDRLEQVVGKESFYAASGSCVQWLNEKEFIMIPTAGNKSFFYRGSVPWYEPKEPNMEPVPGYYFRILYFSPLPFKIQKAGGAYSISMFNQNSGACVGGSYLLPNDNDSVACYTTDSGKTWQPAQTMPGGYRSCVAFSNSSTGGICTGTNGTDITLDGGKNWMPSGVNGYNVCAFSKKFVWLAGNKGTWLRISKKKLPLKKLISL